MPDLLPLFPLPNVVLFPNVFLPLHVFEPRYRQLVADALAADRVIGMVLLKPGWERDYEGRPPVYPVGCSGLVTHVERLSDGRFNLVLRGLERFRILGEEHDRAYRRASVLSLGEERLTADDRAAIQQHRTRLEALIAPPDDRPGDPKIPATMPDLELVNALSQYLDFEPVEKQALLEQPTLRARAHSLVELIEIKTLMARAPGVTNLAH